MKYVYLALLLYLGIIALSFGSCTLDKEPAIPTSATNEKAPVFFSTTLTAITHDSIRAKAQLSSRGNLNILHYGWVWSENPNPTLLDSKIEFGVLGIDSFETLIPGLTLGNTYHFRPYVTTGSGETYGPEKTITMGIPKLEDVILDENFACFLRIQCAVQSPLQLEAYGIVYVKGSGTPTLQKKDGQVPGAGFNNGSFLVDMTMLNPSTAYSIRAYAITSSGIGYSKVQQAITPVSLLLSANFTINTDAEIFQGAIVQFTNTSLGATQYSWNYGDGENSVETSPIHIFNSLGNNFVRLTAENGGCMLTHDTILKIVPDPFQNYWVDIPGGTFMMGCTPEQAPDCASTEFPAHQVTLSPFTIGKTEVTQEQWEAATGNNPSYFFDCGINCPVENISWRRIVTEFIPAMNRKTGRTFRLPTEAEWEYAARGGLDASNQTKFAGSNDTSTVCLCLDNRNFYKPDLVGIKAPNGYGLYDMSGNLAEWCSDKWPSIYTADPVVNPIGPTSVPMGDDRVLRGGGFEDHAIDCRVTSRRGHYFAAGNVGYGVRLVRD